MAELAAENTFPPKIHQMAGHWGLGAPLKEYKANFTSEMIAYSFIILLSAAGFATCVALVLRTAPSIGLGAALGLAIAVSAFIFFFFLRWLPGTIWNIIKWRKMRLYVCVDGLLFLFKGTHYRGMRWDEIVSVTQTITSGNGYHVNTPATLQAADGLKFVLHRYFSNAAELSDTVVQQTSRYLLPEYTARYHAGETVTFGKLSLNQQGLALGAEQLPWSQIESIRVVQGVIEITVSDARSGKSIIWRKFSPTALPNSMIFLSLSETILKQKP